MQRFVWVLFVLICVLNVAPPVAAAHGIVAGGSRVIEVDAGIHHLRIEAIVPTGAPTVLTLKILPLTPFVETGSLRVSAQSMSGIATPQQEFSIPAGIKAITVVDIPIPAVGIWNIAIAVDDGLHQPGVFSLPVTISDVTVPLTTYPLFVAFGLLAMVLGVQVLWLSAPPLVLLISRTVFVSALTCVIALGAIIASPQIRLEWNTPLPLPMPFITSTTTLTDASIDFHLYDGSTGLPVDDIVPHHQSLMHAVCIDPSHNLIRHVHPARVVAGVYKLVRSLIPAGSYECTLEVERANTGTQLLKTHVDIPGIIVARLPGVRLGATQSIEGYEAVVQSDQPVATGVPVTLRVAIAQNGRPVDAIQLWLGMRGHLIVRSHDGALYGHVHAVGPMEQSFEPAVQTGNEVSFVYTFPRDGTYSLWFQIQTQGKILTVPVTMTTKGG